MPKKRENGDGGERVEEMEKERREKRWRRGRRGRDTIYMKKEMANGDREGYEEQEGEWRT
jgi:hypothetical protein